MRPRDWAEAASATTRRSIARFIGDRVDADSHCEVSASLEYILTQNLVGDIRGGAHLPHVVDAHDVCAPEHAGRYRCRRGETGLLRILVHQKMFARRADHHWKIKRPDRGKPPHDERVLLFALAESEARIDHQPCLVDA